jgi:hypothetical protein
VLMVVMFVRSDLKKFIEQVRTDDVSALSFGLVVVVTVFLLVLIHIGGRRWRAEERDPRGPFEAAPVPGGGS